MKKNIILNCCKTKKKTKKCIREDGKTFKLPRKYTKKRCLSGKIRGFTMKSSCAPYKNCKTKKKKSRFLFNPNNPKKSFDVYVDKNPSDTISIKYKTYYDVKNTIKKLETLYKKGKYSHKRIWQVGMIMKVRLGVILKYNKTKDIMKRYKLSEKYFKFLGKRTKLKNIKDRKTLKFNI